MTLGPYIKVLARLVRVSLREENAQRREELLIRFADAADEDIRHLPKHGGKKAAKQPLDKPDETDS